ncbi:MAG TPA: hypothetical protein VK993_04345 [Chthoniobacterales bacterium]|nr:hypothetical protein [Chthoniobacterales bacterium]
MLRFVLTNWLPLPYWDEWSTPGAMFVSWCQGTLSFADFFEQHNESRKVFPRLIYLTLAQIRGGWDVRKEIALLFVTVCAICALFYRLIRATPGATTRAALTAWIAATLLAFSPGQFENFLWGVQLEPFLVGCGVLAIAAVNTSGIPLVWKCVVNATIALLATYTVANGMLLWVLGLPLLARGESLSRRKIYFAYAPYLVCAIAAIRFYFIGYNHPGHHPDLLPEGTRVLALGHYLLLWVGSYFYSPHFDPLAIGAVASVAWLAALGATMRLILRGRSWRTFYPPLLIGAYACVTACVTAFGRIGFGVNQALDMRYRTFSLFFYLALLGLLFAIYCSCVRQAGILRRRVFAVTCGILAVLAMSAWTSSYIAAAKHATVMYHRNLTLLRALEWVDVIPDNPDLLLIYPIIDQLLERTRIVREHKLLRLGFAENRLLKQVRKPPPSDAADSFGRFDTCMFDPNHNLYITGWAWLPDRDRRADCVVIGCQDASGRFKPISVLETGVRRDDFSAEPGRRDAGFSRTFNPANVPAGDITIAAWGIDVVNKKAYPLGGATRVAAGVR